MYGYKVSLKGLPQTVFACSTTVDNYNWKNSNNNRVVEISTEKSEGFTLIVNNETHLFTEGSRLSCIVGDDERYAFSDADIKKEITSVAVCFEELNITAGELCEADAFDNSYFILPAFLENENITLEVTRLLNKFINHYISDLACDKAMCISVWFDILHLIDKHTRELLCTPKHSSVNYYVKKLNYIIENRYNEKISLTKIAEEFGVSMSYLSSTYSSATHQSFKDALFSVRMKKAKELILTTSLSLSDIAGMVGMCDDTYLRKSFKKFFGVSISEFKKINKGLTLYHDKPVRKNW